MWAHYKMVYQIVAPNKTLKLNPIKRCFDKIFYFTEWILLWIRDTDKHAFDQHQPRSSFLLNICPNSLDINSPNASSSVSRQEWKFLPLPANQSQVLETDDQLEGGKLTTLTIQVVYFQFGKKLPSDRLLVKWHGDNEAWGKMKIFKLPGKYYESSR